jgi:hypothetical protein
MICPDVGVWRAWLDEETAVPGPEEHLAVCGSCAAMVAELKATSDLARRQMAMLLSQPVSVERASVEPARRRWPRRGWKVAAAVAVGVALMATPTGRAWGETFLSQFRVERFDLVTLTAVEAARTGEILDRLGEVEGSPLSEPEEVDSVDAALQATGLSLPDLGPDATVAVMEASEMRLGFDSDEVRSYLDEEGSASSIPEGLDETEVIVRRPAAAVVALEEDGRPTLVVGRSGPIETAVEGPMDPERLRLFLLDLPGLPEGLVAQLAAMPDWRSSLPLPVPVDVASASTVDIGGVEATRVDVPGYGTGYVWVEPDDTVTGVAGEDPAETLALARQLAEE